MKWIYFLSKHEKSSIESGIISSKQTESHDIILSVL